MPPNDNEQKRTSNESKGCDPVNPFADFCGKHKLDFSQVNKEKVRTFVDDLNKTGLSAISRMDELKSLDELATYAAFAYAQKWLTKEQVITLLELRTIMIEFSDLDAIPMLDDQEMLTDAARSNLSLFIREDAHSAFMYMMRKLPKSERYFLKFSDEENLNSTAKLIQAAEVLGIIAIRDKLRKDGKRKSKSTHHEKTVVRRTLTTLSAGAMEALTQLRYREHTKSTDPQVGIQTIDAINHSIHQYGRYRAVGFPGIDTTDTFHGIKAKSFYLSLHDEIHRQLASTIPNPLYEALLSAISLVREKTNIHWSKEIWDCLEMEYDEFVDHTDKQRDDSSTSKRTTDFLKLLGASVATEKRLAGLFSPSPFIETTWLLLIDMAVRRDAWLEKNIDPEYFPRNTVYGDIYQFISKHRDALKETQTPAQQVFIMMQLYFANYLPKSTENSQEVHFEKPKGHGNYIQLMQGDKLCFLPKKTTLNPRYDPIYPLFYNKIITLDELIALSDNAIKSLQNPKIFFLAKNNFLSISQLDKLTTKAIDNLESNTITQLFRKGKISIAELNIISDKIIDHLGHQHTANLVETGALSISQMIKMPDQIIEQLAYYRIANLVEDNRISITQLVKLSPETFEKLKTQTIHQRFVDGELSLEQIESMHGKRFGTVAAYHNRFPSPARTPQHQDDMEFEQKFDGPR